MIVATNLKTESGDDYLILLKDVKSPEDYAERIQSEMLDEIAYVCKYSIVTDSESDDSFLLESALREKIDYCSQMAED